jgi:hypothetical protein
VRNLVTLFLAGILGICPLLCEAAGIAQDLHGCEVESTCPHPGEPPAPCSDDGGTCICNGAIQAVDVRMPDLDSAFLPASASLCLPSHAPRLPLAPLPSREGGFVGLAGSGDATSVRSLLQNFRC